MKILVTGASGFVGQHLLRELTSYNVVGTTHRGRLEKLTADFPRVTFRTLDILDFKAVENLVREIRPDACLHLAGISSVDSFAADTRECFRINTEGWMNLLETFRKFSPQSTIVLISSAQVYGNVPAARLPITENAPLSPENFYSLSKGTCEGLAKTYGENFGMRVLILRPFNHVGPGQSTSFVCSSLAKQIAQIAAGLAEPVIRAGNLSSRRDFTDVRDIARAYVLAVSKCKETLPYNICSGKAVSIQEILERLIALGGVKVRVQTESALKRESDPEISYGSCEKFHRATGWVPQIPLEKTLQDTLSYWREQIRIKGVSNASL